MIDGEFLASDAGDQTSMLNFSCDEKPAFNGLIVGIFRSVDGLAGEMKITAQSEELKQGEISIQTG